MAHDLSLSSLLILSCVPDVHFQVSDCKVIAIQSTMGVPVSHLSLSVFPFTCRARRADKTALLLEVTEVDDDVDAPASVAIRPGGILVPLAAADDDEEMKSPGNKLLLEALTGVPSIVIRILRLSDVAVSKDASKMVASCAAVLPAA